MGAVVVGAVVVGAVVVGAVVIGAVVVGEVLGWVGSTTKDQAMSACLDWLMRAEYEPATNRVRGTSSTAWSVLRI